MAIRCIVVTPERTELDREADYVSLPMNDGELGVLKGRAPMIGRLGYGVLRLNTAAGPEKYYVDGGFAQVEDNEISILTGKLIPADLINGDEARAALETAREMSGSKPEEADAKNIAIARARGQLRASR
ncbi:ATP synthase epsilon chain, sodium ion specific [Rubripirellula amarantea]|uniref:ATP synthase epsilon chain n=1 Tax=Rubripirellula amarantea TaxID=2527999 RepID=A0A5C5WI68_9BACT|nr:ATP synthase F1 subunit epsilon [Rubripirellula amarantea]TWT49703.1 ATP synthase epsilon chain, sodium ion specific [Rubripirellula amarantea]